MVCPDDQGFPKRARLLKRSQYLAVQRAARSVHSRAFVGLFVANRLDHARLGITTTRKLGGAVVRNRSRRLVREAFRRGELAVPAGLDLIIIPKFQATTWPNAALRADLALLGERVRSATRGTP
jgi:ribonuclease P protein component